jgi:hypothetical protein
MRRLGYVCVASCRVIGAIGSSLLRGGRTR